MQLTKIREGMSGKKVAEIIDGNFEYIDSKQDIKFEKLDKYLDGKLTEYEEEILTLIEQSFVGTDEEDLTVVKGKAKIKDRKYDKEDNSGMGYKILRKRKYLGKNLLVQSDFDKEDTIYVVRYDFDLNDSAITIPNNCVLQFEGGSMSNGILYGNNTKIIAGLTSIFYTNLILSNVWNITEAYPEWYGAKGDGITDNTISLQSCISNFNAIKISSGIYITLLLIIPSFRDITGEGKLSILKANPSMERSGGFLIKTKDGGSAIRLANLKIMGGATSKEEDYKIGGIGLISTSNSKNDLWDTRNIIENVEIKNCYGASVYIDTYLRENKIQNCFITHTTNVGINCQGTDNMINGCTIAEAHSSGVVLQTNNRLSNTKLFGCGGSTVVKNTFALDVFGNKCNISNIELQQNHYGGVIVRGKSNYVQVTTDNNGSGNPGVVSSGVSVAGSYNTVIATSYNFSFHDDAYERYHVSTNWNTVGNTIIINGTPLNNNKMSILSPWTVDNITNTIISNGFDLTAARSVTFPTEMNVYKYIQKGTGSVTSSNGNLRLYISSATERVYNCILAVIPILVLDIDPNGVISAKMRFKKTGDVNDIIYPYASIDVVYSNALGTGTRTDKCEIIHNFDNDDSIEILVVCSLYHANLKITSIKSISLNICLGSKQVLSDLNVEGYFTNIMVGAKTDKGANIALLNTIGTTEQKPENDLVLPGFLYYDTTLENYIYWNGINWENQEGTSINRVTII